MKIDDAWNDCVVLPDRPADKESYPTWESALALHGLGSEPNSPGKFALFRPCLNSKLQIWETKFGYCSEILVLGGGLDSTVADCGHDG